MTKGRHLTNPVRDLELAKDHSSRAANESWMYVANPQLRYPDFLKAFWPSIALALQRRTAQRPYFVPQSGNDWLVARRLSPSSPTVLCSARKAPDDNEFQVEIWLWRATCFAPAAQRPVRMTSDVLWENIRPVLQKSQPKTISTEKEIILSP